MKSVMGGALLKLSYLDATEFADFLRPQRSPLGRFTSRGRQERLAFHFTPLPIMPSQPIAAIGGLECCKHGLDQQVGRRMVGTGTLKRCAPC